MAQFYEADFSHIFGNGSSPYTSDLKENLMSYCETSMADGFWAQAVSFSIWKNEFEEARKIIRQQVASDQPFIAEEILRKLKLVEFQERHDPEPEED